MASCPPAQEAAFCAATPIAIGTVSAVTAMHCLQLRRESQATWAESIAKPTEKIEVLAQGIAWPAGIEAPDGQGRFTPNRKTAAEKRPGRSIARPSHEPSRITKAPWLSEAMQPPGPLRTCFDHRPPTQGAAFRRKLDQACAEVRRQIRVIIKEQHEVGRGCSQQNVARRRQPGQVGTVQHRPRTRIRKRLRRLIAEQHVGADLGSGNRDQGQAVAQ